MQLVVQKNLPRTGVTGDVWAFCYSSDNSAGPHTWGFNTSGSEKTNQKSTRQGEVCVPQVLSVPFVAVGEVSPPPTPTPKNWQSGRL